MGALFFDGTNDSMKWTTLATPLANVSNGAFTASALVHRASVGTYDAISYLLAGTGNGVAQAGMGFNQDNTFFMDAGAGSGTTATFTNVSERYIMVVRKAAGNVAPIFSWLPMSMATPTWTHFTAAGISGDQAAATMLEIGNWQNATDWFHGHIGLLGFWEGDMSQAQVEALSTNRRTSDWWGHAFGQPEFLAEMNVDAANVIDLTGNATGLTANGPVLDTNETFANWTWDGQGAVPAGDAIGVTDEAAGAGVVEFRTRERVTNIGAEQYLIDESLKVRSAVSYFQDQFGISASQDGAVGYRKLVMNPAGSGVSMGINLIEMKAWIVNPGIALEAGAPEVTMERWSFTGTPTGGTQSTAGKTRTSGSPQVRHYSAAPSGLTMTAGARAYTWFPIWLGSTAGSARTEPSAYDWKPDAPVLGGVIDLQPGECIVFRQATAGDGQDDGARRGMQYTIAVEEYTLP